VSWPEDPFDRMLIAQARAEGLTLVSVDRAFMRYDVPVLGVET
jgi:PIN domain nuclease of toxin-antitoxin system